MNINDNMWNSICVLMNNSLWGKTSSIDSMKNDLNSEVKEFIQACKNNDIINAEEEAADVLMMIMCMLYRLENADEFKPDYISNRVIDKLHWRYKDIFKKDYNTSEIVEIEMWESSKEIENNMKFIFCDNPNCVNFQKLGMENIVYDKDIYKCKSCNNIISSTKNNTLFFRAKRKKQYFNSICHSILLFSKGQKDSAEMLKVDCPESFYALCHYILEYRNKNNENTILKVFTEFLERKYNIPNKEIVSYLNYIQTLQTSCEPYTLLEKYYSRVSSELINAKNTFTIKEWQRITRDITELYFDIYQKIERATEFNARGWDNQIIHKYLIKYPDINNTDIIECMTIFHYKKSSIRDLTIELSTMYNCVVGCRFCASAALPGNPKMIEAIDYVKQINTCLHNSGVNPQDFANFYVSFAGIGEPSVAFKNVATGMIIIHDIYPHVKFNIATFGYNSNCFKYWEELNLPIRTLQIPLYHTNQNKIKGIVSNLPDNYDLKTILDDAIHYCTTHTECRLKVNYIPMEGINDSIADVLQFIEFLNPYRTLIAIKISILNYTKPAEENGFVTSGIEKLNFIKKQFDKAGFTSYIFGTEINTTLGCGQLAQNAISGE